MNLKEDTNFLLHKTHIMSVHLKKIVILYFRKEGFLYDLYYW